MCAGVIFGSSFFFQAEDGRRGLVRSRGLGDVYKRQVESRVESGLVGRAGYSVWATRLDGEADIDTAGLEAHREHSFQKLDAMENYARSRTCLRARILEYFGDATHELACGNCGPCISGGETHEEATTGAEDSLFRDLRETRKAIADRDGVPPFVVFSDATLRDMAKKRPRNRKACIPLDIPPASFRTQFNALLTDVNPVEAGDAPQIDAKARRRPAKCEHRHQALPAAQNFGVFSFAEKPHHFIDRYWAEIIYWRKLHTMPRFRPCKIALYVPLFETLFRIKNCIAHSRCQIAIDFYWPGYQLVETMF